VIRNNKKKRKKERIHVTEGEKEETNTIFDMQTNEINVNCLSILLISTKDCYENIQSNNYVAFLFIKM